MKTILNYSPFAADFACVVALISGNWTLAFILLVVALSLTFLASWFYDEEDEQ